MLIICVCCELCICRFVSCVVLTTMFTCELVLILAALSVRYVFGDCGVVTKKEWEALNPVHVQYLPRPLDLVIIQHTVTPVCDTDASCAEIVRNIQTAHMENLHYWDIGPSFLVGGNGKVYEGAGWLHVGAHTYGYNKKSIGITFIGNFNTDQPTQQALDAAQALIQCGVERGHLKPGYHLVGHRQLLATESPGRRLYSEIRRWPHWLEDVSSIKNGTVTK